MSRLPRTLPVLVLIALAVGTLLAAREARADKKDGRITFEASTEPAALVPGQSGTLVIKGILFEKLHIYGPGDPQAMTWKALEAPGVAYDLAAVALSDTHPHKGEYEDEARPVWEETFTLRVPVTLGKDVAAGTRVGLALTYNGCTDIGCYPKLTDEAAVVVAAPGAAPAAGPALPGGAPPVAPPGVLADAAPKVSPVFPEDEGGAEVKLDEAGGRVVVTFTPSFGWHFYGPASTDGSVHVGVEPQAAEGVTWGKVEQDGSAELIEGPYEIVVPFTRTEAAKTLTLKVTWAGCSGEGAMAKCNPPRSQTVSVTWPGAKTPAVAPPPPAHPEAAAPGEVLFPVIQGGELVDDPGTSLLEFLIIFAAGLLLAFTPCVLPIIPITVSVISGGNAEIPRARLAGLLGTYVLGLCLTFATMGVIAAKTGGAMSDVFSIPGVQWGIVVLFLVLGFGMFGVYELQPPAWLSRLQGGAQKRQGSFLGALLFGCLGAVIASPCTGPAIAALLIQTAKQGNPVLGFSKFFTLGLGMGAVLFAAGSLNFMMRPGPWMTWVRYTFGMLIVGAAMYYLRNYSLVGDVVFWLAGALVCAAAAAGIAWHLHKREMEEKKPAMARGVKVAVLTAAVIAGVAWYTRAPEGLLHWTYAESPQHLKELVDESVRNGKPAVVDFWGTWCTNCKVYDKRIASTPTLRERFEKLTRIKVDLSGEDNVRWPMRRALGVKESGAPVMVFLDRQGRIWRKADLVGLRDAEDVAAHVDVVLRETGPVKTSGH